MKRVRALRSFEYGGSRRRGDTFLAVDRTAEKLSEKGLVEILGKAAEQSTSDPKPPAGKKSSASPAGQASRQKTSKRSAAGDSAKASTGQTEAQAVPTCPCSPETPAGDE